MPLDFIYELSSDSYRFDLYDTDEKLIEKIRTGRGDPQRYTGKDFLYIDAFMGGTDPSPAVPPESLADSETTPDDYPSLGLNKIVSAKAVSYSYVIALARNPDIDEEAYNGWEQHLSSKLDEMNFETATVHLFTIQGFIIAVSEDINGDLALIFVAIILVAVYTYIMLGNFSPIHCRCLVTSAGLLCVLLAYTGGFGLMYFFGGRTTGVHQLMPFLLIGIGVDDMFVMCNAVDQTKLKSSAFKRINEAMGHAGPAITITSLTNALAFAFGATTSLAALKSFCLFASLCILMLYFACLSVFLSILVLDTRRVEAKNREMCGACCCDETSVICCKGKLASPK